MKRITTLILLLFISMSLLAKEFRMTSPDGKIIIYITVKNDISWKVLFKGQHFIDKGYSNLHLNHIPVSDKIVAGKSTFKSVEKCIYPTVPNKASKIKDRYNELHINLNNRMSIRFRAYDNGIAYRFESNINKDIYIDQEGFSIQFTNPDIVYFPEENSFISHYERVYKKLNIQMISDSAFSSLPVFMKTKDKFSVLITESDLYDYPAMFLKGSKHIHFEAVFPNHVLKAKPKGGNSDRNEEITEEAAYLAKTKGKRTFPWRVIMIGENDADIIENNLVFQLARPLKLEETKWIKPGKVAWDWWNALNISNVDFISGINTATYKYYIDFASKYRLDYIILDEGWSKTTLNVKEYKAEVDVKELIRYGKEKNVGIILWLLWKPLDNETEEILNLYESWGVKGIKVDFMQRADQYMVNFYEKVAKIAAKHRLIVDFHGAFKPAGLRRAYPNVLTYEGVKGLENVKWSTDITPEHNLIIPFIRMAAGPMDYTPGAMINAHEDNFAIRFKRPMSIGTRCHQLAMYVIYESPLQMLCDNPTIYYKEDECTRFISKIPVVWDETKVIKAEIEEILVIARRNGKNWYVGALNDTKAKQIKIDLSFLSEGIYSAEIMKDGINADKNAEDYKKVVKKVTNNDQFIVNLASGGGWCAIIEKQ